MSLILLVSIIGIIAVSVYLAYYFVSPYNTEMLQVSTEQIHEQDLKSNFVIVNEQSLPNFAEKSASNYTDYIDNAIMESIDNTTDNKTKSFRDNIDLQSYKERALQRYEQRLMDDTTLTGVFIGWFCTPDNDRLAPETEMLINGVQGEHGWYVSDVVIKPNATDICTGIKRTIIRDTSRPAIQWELTPSSHEYRNGIVLKSKLDMSHPRGTHIIEYFSIDNSHNVEREKQLRIRLDYQDPYLSLWNQSNIVHMQNEGRYNMQIHASDFHSGIDYIMVDPCAGQYFIKTCKPIFFNNTHDNTYTMKPSMYLNYTQYLKKGIYDYVITAVDYAGHKAYQKVIVFVATAIPKPR